MGFYDQLGNIRHLKVIGVISGKGWGQGPQHSDKAWSPMASAAPKSSRPRPQALKMLEGLLVEFC